jgi:hypothetical protein
MGVGKVPVITVTRVPTTTELDCYWGGVGERQENRKY